MSDLTRACAELVRLSEQATPEPWRPGRETVAPDHGRGMWERFSVCGETPPEADADLIALARNEAPRMARVLLAILPHVERLRDAYDGGLGALTDVEAVAGTLLAAFDAATKEPT